MADVTAKVPNNTLFYTYTAFGSEIHIDLGSVEFMHLEELQNLTISTVYDEHVFDRRLNFSNSSQTVFKPLSNLKNLSISITWNMSQPMHEMFSFLNHLETLDLSFTRLINYDQLTTELERVKGQSCFALDQSEEHPDIREPHQWPDLQFEPFPGTYCTLSTPVSGLILQQHKIHLPWLDKVCTKPH